MEVAINPEELEGLDSNAIRALYEQRLEEEKARHSREVSSLIFEVQIGCIYYLHIDVM